MLTKRSDVKEPITVIDPTTFLLYCQECAVPKKNKDKNVFIPTSALVRSNGCFAVKRFGKSANDLKDYTFKQTLHQVNMPCPGGCDVPFEMSHQSSVSRRYDKYRDRCNCA